MQTKFDIQKTTVITQQELAVLLTQLKEKTMPASSYKTASYEYICDQMRIVHEFFITKLGNDGLAIHHVIDWMVAVKLLDSYFPEWIEVKAHMSKVVSHADSCSVLLLALSKNKASDVSYHWTGHGVTGNARSGTPYLYTATNDTPYGIGDRVPCVIFYGTPF